MTNVQMHRQSEQGFTLVELAIVMVIIGLLIGGILKGQELIANAKISGTVGQLKGLDAAMNTFQDKYGVKPGLMSNATTRLPGCTTPCANVTGTTYGTNLNQPTAATESKVQAFLHLNAADLISGIDSSTNTLTFGSLLPASKAGGGMWIGTAASATELGTGGTLSSGRAYAVINGSVATPGGTNGALNPTTAAQIDRKMDDGQPRTGTVQSEGSNCQGTTAPIAYNESNTGGLCTLVSRVLN